MTMDWFGASLTPLEGGYSGETFLVGDDPADQVVLRIYRRNPDRAVVDASLLRLVRGILPVPEVIEARPARGDEPALLVTEKLPGVPLDALLRAAPRGVDWEEIGLDLGYLLARLSGIPFLQPGMFSGPELTVSQLDSLSLRSAVTVSWPEPHETVSRSPSLTEILSLPDPPRILSEPEPPTITSSPLSPSRTSSPLSPKS